MSASVAPTNGANDADHIAAPLPADTYGSVALRAAAALARRWRQVVATALVTAAVATLAALVLPKSYVAGTLLVPYASGGSRSSVGAASIPTGLGSFLGAISASSPAERILGPVLTSGTLFDTVLHRAARQVGTRDAEDRVRDILRHNVRIARNGDGSMSVQVRSGDPALAALIANTYPGAINDILARVSAEGTRTKQAFLRAQLDSADARLSESERKFIQFAQQRSAPAAEQQAQRTLEAAAALQQGIFDQEVAVAQLRRTSTPNNPELRAAEAQLASRREQLARLTSGGVSSRSVFVPIERGAELRVAASRVEREYRQDQSVYASLAAAVTDAQIDISNSLPVLTVLDPATPPGDPTLKVSTALGLGLTLGTLFGVIGVVVAELLERLRGDPTNAALLASFPRPRAVRSRAAAS